MTPAAALVRAVSTDRHPGRSVCGASQRLVHVLPFGIRTCRKAGAKSVTAIESNTRAFLKCLCVKEIFRLQRTCFELGDFIKYLEEEREQRYDVLFASGVLYHMVDPINFLELITRASDRIFIWTHYYDREAISLRSDAGIFGPSTVLGDGIRGSKRTHPADATSWPGFSGGRELYAIGLERASILQFLDRKGFQTEIAFEAVDHPNGPSFAVSAKRM
ncbi:MAG: hypothetical protein QM674_09950 [Burkholderiaceae bacterium]